MPGPGRGGPGGPGRGPGGPGGFGGPRGGFGGPPPRPPRMFGWRGPIRRPGCCGCLTLAVVPAVLVAFVAALIFIL